MSLIFENVTRFNGILRNYFLPKQTAFSFSKKYFSTTDNNYNKKEPKINPKILITG